MAQFHYKALALVEQHHWNDAHDLVHDNHDELSCLIHGYLHRLEGDTVNARYWYRRGGQCLPTNSLADEFVRLSEYIARHE